VALGLTAARGSRARRAVVAAALGAAALVAVSSLGATSAVAGPTLPTLKATIGGPGHATMYPSGVEYSAADNTLVVADTGNDLIEKFSLGPGGTPGSLIWSVGGYGTGNAQFQDPRDVGVDSSGDIFVADTTNVRIQELDINGAYVTQWKGPSTDKIGSPIGITVSGNKVYVADAAKHLVRIFNTSGTQLDAFGSVGSCTFSNIRDAAADSSGNIYIANYLNNDILKISSDGTQCLKKWGTKGTGAGQFKNPYGVAIATDPVLGKQAVYVADSNNNRIQEFDTSGNFVAQWGSFDSVGDNASGQFTALRRVAVGPNGDLWGADLWGYDVDHADRTSTGYQTDAGLPSIPEPPVAPAFTDSNVFNQVRGVDVDSSGDVYAMDTVNQRVVQFDPAGHLVGACGKRGWQSGAFNWPRGVALDPSTGNIWVADTKQSRLQVLSPMSGGCTSAVFIGAIGSGPTQFNYPYSVAIRSWGTDPLTAWIGDSKNNRIEVYDVATKSLITTFGSLGSGTGQFKRPSEVSVNQSNGRILVADTGNNRIVELSWNPTTHAIAVVRTLNTFGTNRKFRAPSGVAADPNGVTYVADSLHDQVVVLSADWSSSSVLLGGFNRPENVFWDQVGDRLLVSDTYNDRIEAFGY
jgi:DNA-binding beta-propeller fold protein YncE